MPPYFAKTRLAAMMFIQYVVLGTTWPIMSLYLRDHRGFTGTQAGVVLAMSAVAALIGPLAASCVADRLLRAERLLSLCHVLAAGLMAVICSEPPYGTMVGLYLAYNLAVGPTVPLTMAIVFHHHPDGGRGYGHIRVWGTIGWIVVAWAFGYLWLRGSGTAAVPSRLPDALRLSALTSLCLAGYALSLPRSRRQAEGPLRLIPRDSLAILARPQILLLGAISLLVGVVDRYYYFGMAPFLSHAGFRDAAILPLMSLGQISEVGAMFGLAALLRRLGYKPVLLLGLLAEVIRFSVYAWGRPQALIVAAIPCHGLAYALYFTAVYIYLDSHTDARSRAGLHQLFSILTAGVGSLVANLLGGYCLDRFAVQGAGGFRSFWLVPAGGALSALLVTALLFRKPAATAADT